MTPEQHEERLKPREPDIYEVLLIGGGNDGRRIGLSRDFIDKGQPVALEYCREQDLKVKSFLNMIKGPKTINYIVEYYHIERLFGNWLVGRHSNLTVEQMWRLLHACYKSRHSW